MTVTVYALVYALVDPRTHEVRYIGATKNPLQNRLRAHLSQAMKGHPQRSRKVVWLRDLLESGSTPYIVKLECVADRLQYEAECRWIAIFSGSPLTNQKQLPSTLDHRPGRKNLSSNATT